MVVARAAAVAKCEELIRVGGGEGEYRSGKGSLSGRTKKKRKRKNDKKEKGMKKLVGKADKKKKRTKRWEFSHLVKF